MFVVDPKKARTRKRAALRRAVSCRKGGGQKRSDDREAPETCQLRTSHCTPPTLYPSFARSRSSFFPPLSPDPQPVGGHVMAHASTIRLSVRKGKAEQRLCKVVDSPNLPEGEASYAIGVTGIEDYKCGQRESRRTGSRPVSLDAALACPSRARASPARRKRRPCAEASARRRTRPHTFHSTLARISPISLLPSQRLSARTRGFTPPWPSRQPSGQETTSGGSAACPSLPPFSFQVAPSFFQVFHAPLPRFPPRPPFPHSFPRPPGSPLAPLLPAYVHSTPDPIPLPRCARLFPTRNLPRFPAAPASVSITTLQHSFRPSPRTAPHPQRPPPRPSALLPPFWTLPRVSRGYKKKQRRRAELGARSRAGHHGPSAEAAIRGHRSGERGKSGTEKRKRRNEKARARKPGRKPAPRAASPLSRPRTDGSLPHAVAVWLSLATSLAVAGVSATSALRRRSPPKRVERGKRARAASTSLPAAARSAMRPWRSTSSA